MNKVTLSCSYLIRNCLPFEINVNLLKPKPQTIVIPKAKKVFIENLKLTEPLAISFNFLDFRSYKKDTILFNDKNKVF